MVALAIIKIVSDGYFIKQIEKIKRLAELTVSLFLLQNRN